ncbi:MAG: DUF1493 family protein [Flavobacteriia bacterium]|nr:DUF1493 family protein [Flavobacteriia bacterium]
MNDEKQNKKLKEQISKFISDITCCKNVKDETDIFLDLDVYGDDFDELIDNYSKEFNVDMESYLWYFHTNEEGQNLGGNIIKPPYERVSRIPVTPNMLFEFAKSGEWQVNYPEHKLPKKRYDIYINMTIFVIVILLIIWKYIY